MASNRKSLGLTTTFSKRTVEKSLDQEYGRLATQIDHFNVQNNEFTTRESKLARQVQSLKEKASILKKREAVLKDKKLKLAKLEES